MTERPLRAAEVLAEETLTRSTTRLTRRQLREAARRGGSSDQPEVATELATEVTAASAAPLAAAATEATSPTLPGPTSQPEQTDEATEYEFAAVALTLSRLAVAATAFSADVENAPAPAPVAPPVSKPQPLAQLRADAAALTEPAAAPESAAAPTEPAAQGEKPSTARQRRRDLRAARIAAGHSDLPAVPAAPRGNLTHLTGFPEVATWGEAAEAQPSAMTLPPLAPRLGVGAKERSEAGSRSATAVRQWVPRLAVLSALGAATVITPIVAASTTEEIEIAPVVPLADSSALETLTAVPAAVDEATARAAEPITEAATADSTAELLATDQLAELRSTVAASRADTREELPRCGEPDAAAPNGVLAALEPTEYVSLSMPIQEGVYRLTSQFGPRWGSVHSGTDFAASAGTPIHAIADGTVIYAGGGKDGRSGMLVIIEHEIDGEKVESWYVHMYPDGVYVEAGDTIKVGDVIGAVGSYGNSTGPHLHLEIHTGDLSDPYNSAVDPLTWLRNHDATPLTSTEVCA